MNQSDKIIKFFKNTFFILPLIYFVGALLDSYDVFLRDFIYGAPFLLAGIYFLFKNNISLFRLSCAYFLHASFDLFYLFLLKTLI